MPATCRIGSQPWVCGSRLGRQRGPRCPRVRAASVTKLFPLLVVNFIGTVGFSLVLPFLVFLVTDWGGNAFVYGVAGATYSSFQLVGAPVLGRWSDRYGRRKILLLSQAGTLVSWLASVIGLILGGMLFATFGPKVFWVSAAVTFMVALVGVTSSGGRPRP